VRARNLAYLDSSLRLAGGNLPRAALPKGVVDLPQIPFAPPSWSAAKNVDRFS